MDIVPQKHCPTCDTVKPVTEFHKCRSKRDGLWDECKACKCARLREWYRRNPEAYKATQKRSREKRKAKDIRYEAPTTGTRVCSACHQEKPVTDFYRDRGSSTGLHYRCAVCERAQSLAYRDKDRERSRATRRAWAERNKGNGRAQATRAAYREKNRELLREKNRQYSAAHPLQRKERVMRRNARKRATRVGPVSYQRIWERDRGFCYLCGLKVEPKDCWYDHIIPLSKGGPHTEDNIAVTHSWCNQRKSSRVVKYRQDELL